MSSATASRDTVAAGRVPAPPAAPCRVQRAIPAPFQRPSISIGAAPAAPRRHWRTVAVTAVAAGDILPGIGLVAAVHEMLTAPAYRSGLAAEQVAEAVSWTVSIRGGDGNQRTFHGGDRVLAFTHAGD